MQEKTDSAKGDLTKGDLAKENLSKGDLAKSYFKEGYNCTQSVALAFAEEIGIEKTRLLRMASSFGGGMGRMRGYAELSAGCFWRRVHYTDMMTQKIYRQKKNTMPEFRSWLQNSGIRPARLSAANC